MTEIPKTERPIAIVILGILTIAAITPTFVSYFVRDPLEVAFKYPSPNRPQLDIGTYFAVGAMVYATRVIVFIIGVMTGIAILRKQRWAWFAGIGLHALAVVVYGVGLWLMPFYSANEQFASITISLVSLYLLSRSDVRNYLRPVQSA